MTKIITHLGLVYWQNSGRHFQHIKTSSELHLLVIWQVFLAPVTSKRPVKKEGRMLCVMCCAGQWFSTSGNIYSVSWTGLPTSNVHKWQPTNY